MAQIRRSIWINSVSSPTVVSQNERVSWTVNGNFLRDDNSITISQTDAEFYLEVDNSTRITNGVQFQFRAVGTDRIRYVSGSKQLQIQINTTGIAGTQVAERFKTLWNSFTPVDTGGGGGTEFIKRGTDFDFDGTNIATIFRFKQLDSYIDHRIVSLPTVSTSVLDIRDLVQDTAPGGNLPSNFIGGSWNATTQTLTPITNWTTTLPSTIIGPDGKITNLEDLWETYTVFDDAIDHSDLQWVGAPYKAGEKFTTLFLEEIKRFTGGIKDITSVITSDANGQKSVTITITNSDDTTVNNTFQLASDVNNVTSTESTNVDGQRSVLLTISKTDGTEVTHSFNLAPEVTDITSEEIIDSISGQKSVKLKIKKADNSEVETDFNLNTRITDITSSQTVTAIGQILVKLGFKESDGTEKDVEFTVPLPSVTAENVEFINEPVNVLVTPNEDTVINLENIKQDVDLTVPNTIVEFNSSESTNIDLTTTKQDVELNIPQVNVEFAALGVAGQPGIGFVQIYRKSINAPVKPTGGSFSFITNTLTPPTDWSQSIDSGLDGNVYATQSVLQEGVPLVWAEPYQITTDTNTFVTSGETNIASLIISGGPAVTGNQLFVPVQDVTGFSRYRRYII